MMQVSVTSRVVLCVCACVHAAHFVTLLHLAKMPRLKLFLCFSAGHTRAPPWHLLCGCRKISFSPPLSSIVWGRQYKWNCSVNVMESRFQALGHFYNLSLPLACEVTFEARKIIFRKIGWSYPPVKKHFWAWFQCAPITWLVKADNGAQQCSPLSSQQRGTSDVISQPCCSPESSKISSLSQIQLVFLVDFPPDGHVHPHTLTESTPPPPCLVYESHLMRPWPRPFRIELSTSENIICRPFSSPLVKTNCRLVWGWGRVVVVVGLQRVIHING